MADAIKSASLRENHPVVAATRQHLHQFFDDASQRPGVEPSARLAAEYERMIELLTWQQEQQYETPYLEHSAKTMKDVLMERHGVEAVKAHVKSMNEHYCNTLSTDQYIWIDAGESSSVH